MSNSIVVVEIWKIVLSIRHFHTELLNLVRPSSYGVSYSQLLKCQPQVLKDTLLVFPIKFHLGYREAIIIIRLSDWIKLSHCSINCIALIRKSNPQINPKFIEVVETYIFFWVVFYDWWSQSNIVLNFSPKLIWSTTKLFDYFKKTHWNRLSSGTKIFTHLST